MKLIHMDLIPTSSIYLDLILVFDRYEISRREKEMVRNPPANEFSNEFSVLHSAKSFHSLESSWLGWKTG